MNTKHVLREARVQLRRYRSRLSDEIRRGMESEIDKLAEARREGQKDQARKIAKSLVKKIRTHTPKTAWHHTIETVESFAIAIVVALAIRHFFIEPFKIPTGSMEPTLHGSVYEPAPRIGDFIMVSKFAYGPKIPFTSRRLWNTKPKRWDIVVFSTRGINTDDGRPAASDPARNFVKRIVGLPGETLEIREGWLYVNGEKVEMPKDVEQRLINNKRPGLARYLDAPYEPAPERTHGYLKYHYPINLFGLRPFPPNPELTERVAIGPWKYGLEGKPFIVPEGHYFMMGDNSPQSADSRAWGFVPFENIKGKVLCVWYPIRKWRAVN